jgi:hypothetical protein
MNDDARPGASPPAGTAGAADEGVHPSPEDLARLVGDAVTELEAHTLHAHLSRCGRCFALYAEMLRAEVGFRSGALARETSRAWLDLGREVAQPGAAVAARGEARAPARRRWLPLAAAAAIVVAGVVWMRAAPRRDGEIGSAPWIAPVRQAIAPEVPQGWSLAGGIAPGARDVHRSAPDDRGPGFRAALQRLEDLNGSPATRSEDAAYWYGVALVADRDLRAAEDHVFDSRQRYPRSRRLRVLEALVVYRSNQPERAAAVLRGLVAEDSADPTPQINLLHVLEESGGGAEAAALRSSLERRRTEGGPRPPRTGVPAGDSN